MEKKSRFLLTAALAASNAVLASSAHVLAPLAAGTTVMCALIAIYVATNGK